MPYPKSLLPRQCLLSLSLVALSCIGSRSYIRLHHCKRLHVLTKPGILDPEFTGPTSQAEQHTQQRTAHCLVGMIRPGMLYHPNLTASLVSKLQTFDMSDCYVYLKEPEISETIRSKIHEWLSVYITDLQKTCNVVKFRIFVEMPQSIPESTRWSCGGLAQHDYKSQVALPQQLLLEQCYNDLSNEERYLGQLYAFVTKLRVDAVWPSDVVLMNTSSQEKVTFSVNRNPSCGFGTIDWFISSPREYAEIFFNSRRQVCPPEALGFSAECKDVRCFGNECMNIYLARNNVVPYAFLNHEQAPMLAHWLGYPKIFDKDVHIP